MQEKISMRQMMRVVYISPLAVAAEVVPSLAGMGAAAWLAPLLCILVVLPLVWLAFWKSGDARQDLGQSLLTGFGKTLGRLPAVLFLLWALFLLVLNAARCAQRLTMAEGTPVVFSFVVVGLAVWLAAGGLPAFARSCEIFCLATLAGLFMMALLGLFRLEPTYIFLFDRAELFGALQMVPSILGVCSVALYALFLAGDISVRKSDRARVLRWSALFFGTICLLLLLILGSFGAPLTALTERPLLQMVTGLSFAGAFQRLESLVSALWMLGDVALLGLLLFSVRRLTALLRGGRESLWPLFGAGLLAFLGGELLAGHTGLLQFCHQTVLPVGGLVAGALFFSFLLCLRRKTAASHRQAGGGDGAEQPVEKVVEDRPKKRDESS